MGRNVLQNCPVSVRERPRLLGPCVLTAFIFAFIHLILVIWGTSKSKSAAENDFLPPSLTLRSPIYKGSKDAIPVAGVGVPNDHALLLLRMVYSIDFQIEHLLILYSEPDDMLRTELKLLTNSILPTVRDTHLKQQSRWLGVSETWNAVIRFSPAAPWYLILSLDVQFVPGSLEAFALQFWSDVNQHGACQGFISWLNPDMFGGYSTFSLSSSFVRLVGLFDENIYPAYYEDTEYDLRVCKLEQAGIKLYRQRYENVTALHGLFNDGKYESAGVVSRLSALNSRVSRRKLTASVVDKFTIPYLRKKWGCYNFSHPQWNCICPFQTPFNLTSSNLSYWVLDNDRRTHIERMLLS